MKRICLLAILVLCQQNLVEGGILLGVSGDGTPDLVAQENILSIDTDGTTIASFDIVSEQGIFTGGPASGLGAFQIDTNFRIADSAVDFNGLHSLGAVIGSEWTGIDLFDDLTFTLDSLFLRGDADNNGVVNEADPDFINDWLFLGGNSAPIFDAADANDNGVINAEDRD